MTAQTYPEVFQRHAIANSARSTVRVRMICIKDRALIYHTIACLQGAGLAYRGCRTNCFLVVYASNDTADIKAVGSALVYLTSRADIVPGLPREELATRAEEWHWDALHCLFAGMEYNMEEGTNSRLRSIIPHATRPTRPIQLDALDANSMQARLLVPLLRQGEYIPMHTMLAMPQDLASASALHSSYFLDMNFVPPLWSLTKLQRDLEGNDHEDRDGSDGPRKGKRTANPSSTMVTTFSLPKRSPSIICTSMRIPYSSSGPSSAKYWCTDYGRETQVV